MRIEIAQGEQRREFEVTPRMKTLGGHEDDDICIAGLPRGLVTIALSGPVLTLVSKQMIRVGDSSIPAGVRHLVTSDAAFEIAPGCILRRLSATEVAPSMKTGFLLKRLVEGQANDRLTHGASFLCIAGSDVGRRFPLTESECKLGRNRNAEITLRDRSVSKQHALVRKEGETYIIEDASSGNGILIHGCLVSSPTPLKHGDVVTLGHVLLQFENPIQATPATSEVPSKPEAVAQIFHLEQPQPGPTENKPPLILYGLALLFAGLSLLFFSAV